MIETHVDLWDDRWCAYKESAENYFRKHVLGNMLTEYQKDEMHKTFDRIWVHWANQMWPKPPRIQVFYSRHDENLAGLIVYPVPDMTKALAGQLGELHNGNIDENGPYPETTFNDVFYPKPPPLRL